MKELVNKEKIYLEDYEVNVNPYLTFNQIDTIVNAILEEDNFLGRQMVKDMYIIKFATDIEMTEEVTSDEYDKYILSGLLDEIKPNIINLYLVDKLVNKADSIEISVKKSLNSLETTIDNFLVGTEKILDKAQKKLPKEMKNLNVQEIMGLIKSKVSAIDK